jgi:hypothetical protein
MSANDPKRTFLTARRYLVQERRWLKERKSPGSKARAKGGLRLVCRLRKESLFLGADEFGVL